jgi:hypothetical protein
VAEIKGIRKVSKGKHHRQIEDRGIEELEELVIRVPEVPIHDIPIRSGPTDHRKIWTVELSKGEFRISTI